MIITSEINQEIIRVKFVVRIASEWGYRGWNKWYTPCL